MRARNLALLLLCVALSTGGCIQTTQTWTIYPDGSGRLVVKNQLPAKKQDGVPMGSGHGSMEGAIQVASRVEQGEDADHVVVVTESLFEDFNKVKYEGKAVGSWKATSEGGYEAQLFKESAGQSMPASKDGKPGAPDPAMIMKLVASQMKGLMYRMEIRMPGKVEKTNGEQTDPRTAALVITEKTFMDDKKREAIAKMEALVAVCGQVDPAVAKEAEAFRAELKKAKEAHAADAGARGMDSLLNDDDKVRQEGEKAAGGDGKDHK